MVMTSEATIRAAKALIDETPDQLAAYVAPSQVMQLDDEKVVERLRIAVEGSEFQRDRG